MPGRRRELCVAGYERSCEELCQGEIDGIVRRHVVAELPDAGQKDIMGVTVNGEGREIIECLKRTLMREITKSRISTQHLGDLNIDEMWCVERLFRREQSSLDRRPSLGDEERLDQS